MFISLRFWYSTNVTTSSFILLPASQASFRVLPLAWPSGVTKSLATYFTSCAFSTLSSTASPRVRRLISSSTSRLAIHYYPWRGYLGEVTARVAGVAGLKLEMMKCLNELLKYREFRCSCNDAAVSIKNPREYS